MTQAAFNMALLKRVARVSVVALCTASSLVLLGAMPANEQAAPAAIEVSVVPAPAAVEAPVIPAVAAEPAKVELLVDAVPAAAALPAGPKTRVIQMEVTAYCACTHCCGPNAQGITASGKPVSYNGGKFVAADTSVLPFGTELIIPGYAGEARVEVIDRGGAIKGNKLDLYFDSHEAALEWGRQTLDVTVIE